MAEETEVVDTASETQSSANDSKAAEVAAAASDNTTIDRPALESKVKAGLASVFNSDPDPVEEEVEEKETADDGKAAQVEAGVKEKEADTEAAAPKEGEVEGDEPPTEPAKADAPTLPAAYTRTLKAYGWSDEEIAANFKAFGAKFLDTAARLHANRSEEVAGWAEAGRNARQQQQQPRTDQGQFAPKPASGPQVLKPVDVAALKKKYGDDELIDAITGPVNSAIEQINQIVPSLQQSTQQAQRAEIETLSRQIESFFTGKDLEPYKELYGNSSESALTSPMIESRNKVLEFADALIAGARLQNRNLTLGQALTLAHDSVSGGFKATAARKELKGKLTARAKGISLIPNGRKAAVASKSGDRSSLEKKVKAGLASVFA